MIFQMTNVRQNKIGDEPIVKSQLNIDKIKSENKPNFIDFLQRSIANERSKKDARRR